MTTLIYRNTKWAVLQSPWPESPELSGDFKLNPLDWLDYENAIEAAIASAIDVREEDQAHIKRLIFVRSSSYYPHADANDTTEEIELWKPQENFPYPLEIEYEIKCYYRSHVTWVPCMLEVLEVERIKGNAVRKVAVLKPLKERELLGMSENISGLGIKKVFKEPYSKNLAQQAHEQLRFKPACDSEGSDVPEESQEELWDELGIMCWDVVDHTGDFKVTEEMKSKFHLTRKEK